MGSDGAAPRGRPAGTAEEQRSIEGIAARGWGEVPPRLAADRGSDITLDCGWGRLVFGQTFDDPAVLAATMADEELGRRDICLYATDPHVVIGLAPQELFLDPSHTYRLLFRNYQPRHSRTPSVLIRGVREAGDASAINRIYRAQGMVPAPPETIWANQRTTTFTYLVAENTETGEVIGTVTGVDHVAAFDDPEGGTSLWCLAVDPHCSLPSVGENLVRTLLDRYHAMGRNFLDLSVMHDNEPAIQLYEKLGFRRVPVYSIKRKNPVNEPLFVPATVERIEDLNPYARILADEALRRGIEVEVIDPDVGEMRFTLGARSVLTWESSRS
ncbi:MAG: GNAT family N-acetyltransferase [Microthrixaceae bacterium]